MISFQLEDIGVKDCQMFQGRGVSYTEFDEVFIGVGFNYHEALSDALEQAATQGFDIPLSDEEIAEEAPDTETDEVQAFKDFYSEEEAPEEDDDDDDDPEDLFYSEDLFYYAAVYVKQEDEQDTA